jgi:hypothetical protein
MNVPYETETSVPTAGFSPREPIADDSPDDDGGRAGPLG